MPPIARRRVTFVLLANILLAAVASHGDPADATRPKTDRPISPSKGPVKLFDGKSLDGLYTWLQDTKLEDPHNVFRVTDGMLHITGEGMGSVITKSAYGDYHLVLEFKWGYKTWRERAAATRDSGLLIHSTGANGGYQGIWMPSIEVQIIEGGVGDFILVNGPDESGKPVPISLTAQIGHDRYGEVIWDPNGKKETFDAKNRRRINWFGRDPDWKDTIGFRGARDVESPHGRWTRIDVIADGNHVEVFVNGTKVNEATHVSPAAGKLQLQSELAEIFVRRWELWPVAQGPKPAHAKSDTKGVARAPDQ
jgi:hypothetical protein